MGGCPSKNDRTGRAGLAAGEANEFVLAYHDLVDQLALAQRYQLGLVEGGCNLAAVVHADVMLSVHVVTIH